MGSTFYYGRRVTANDVGLGFVGSSAQRFYVPNDLTETIIAYRMGVFGGRQYGVSGDPSLRLGVANRSSGGSPTDLLASTAVIQFTNTMSYGGDGAYYEAGLETPILMTPKGYALGVASGWPGLAHGMIAAASIVATNENFYSKTGIAANWYPTNPVGGSGSNEGHMSICVVGVTNTAPGTPGSMSPSGTQSNGDLTPTMTSTFSDAEEVLPDGRQWDHVTTVHIQVQTTDGATTLWDHVYSASPTEQANNVTSVDYAGNALTAGVNYRWRIAHSDRAGAQTWSGWVTFNVNPGGTISTPSAPTGKQLTQTPAGITAVWSHVGGLAMNLVHAHIYDVNGSYITSKFNIAKSAANGATFTVTWAETAFGNLTKGVGYQVRLEGRDTGGVWAPVSGARAFTINAAPTTPTNLYPPSGSPVTALPMITAETSDADNVTSTLTMTIELTLANATVLTRTMTYQSGNTFRYQVTGADVPSQQTFSYRIRSSDGTWVSEWSSPASIVYGAGPVITITAPTQNAVLTTSTPTITWTAPGQVSRRVEVWEYGTTNVFNSGAFETTASLSYTIPAGILRNGHTYQVYVFVRNAVPLESQSVGRTVSLSFVAPASVAGFTAYPVQVGDDNNPSAIQMNWTPSIYPQSNFAGYDVFRRALSGPYEPGEDELVWLRRITSPLQTTFVDYHPRSGVVWEYVITQSVRQDLDIIASNDTKSQSQITLDDVLLVSALSPTVYRMNLRYIAGGEGMSHDLQRGQRQAVPVGARVGRTVRSAYRSWGDSGRFMVVTDRYKTADERIKDIRDAVQFGKTFSFRDHKNRRRWVTIVGYSETDRGSYYEVDIQLREEEFTEGEDATALTGV